MYYARGDAGDQEYSDKQESKVLPSRGLYSSWGRGDNKQVNKVTDIFYDRSAKKEINRVQSLAGDGGWGGAAILEGLVKEGLPEEIQFKLRE